MQYSTAKNISANHGFFGRNGGVSEGVFASLNCGVGSSDTPENAVENRSLVQQELRANKLITLHQTHSNMTITNPTARVEGDAIVTNQRGLAIGVLTADCLPLLFEDSQAGIIGAAHAGWKGAHAGIAESCIAAMQELGAKNIRAAIGPCLQEESFEVQQDFIDIFLKQSAQNQKFFKSYGAQTHFNNVEYVAEILQRKGVENIEIIAEDTLSQPEKFFSYRHSRQNNHADYGRQISAICL